MKYVKFGNTGVEVSALCLGAMTFYERNDEETSMGIVKRALDKGINFIDTADAYGPKTSEEFLGKALQGIRDDVFLATKFYVPYTKGQRLGGGMALSRKHIVRYVEDTLKRLQTDYVDLMQLHHPNPKVSVEETLSALDSLVKAGKVLYIGVSNHYAWQMAHLLGVSALHDWEPIVSIQARYNMLDRVVEQEMVPFCKRFNIAMMAYGPQDGGVLTGRYKRGEGWEDGSRVAMIPSMQTKLTDELFDILDKITEIGAKYGLGMNQLAIRWIMEQPFCVIPLVGGHFHEHFDPLYDAVDVEIDAADIKLLNDLTSQYRFGEFQNQHMVGGSSPALNRW